MYIFCQTQYPVCTVWLALRKKLKVALRCWWEWWGINLEEKNFLTCKLLYNILNSFWKHMVMIKSLTYTLYKTYEEERQKGKTGEKSGIKRRRSSTRQDSHHHNSLIKLDKVNCTDQKMFLLCGVCVCAERKEGRGKL